MSTCELQGCQSKGAAKEAIGTFMVLDGKQETMTRPAKMCGACCRFAEKCGMTVKLRGPA
jgi:hypothetical protein